MSEDLDPDVAAVFTSKFVSSWISTARPGDLADPDPVRRSAAWAQWALGSMHTFRGHSEREYVGLVLPGKFYESGSATLVRPHLELPAAMLAHPDPLFPSRLASAGNALRFPWWLVPEVTAVRRAMFGLPRGEVAGFLEVLETYRSGLVHAVKRQTDSLGEVWPEVEASLVTEPARLSQVLREPWTASEICAVLPGLRKFDVQLNPDTRLSERSGDRFARRVGVWQVRGNTGTDGEFSLGVLTPRLTRSSLFTDPLFDPAFDSTAALMGRSLVLGRVQRYVNQGGPGPVTRTATTPSKPGVFLRAVPARVGEKMPEASLEAAVAFVQAYPRGQDAWRALTEWASDRPRQGGPCQAVLTVSEDGFLSAHRAVRRSVARAEAPSRDDVNVILPLAWDANSKVVRVTLARPGSP